MSPDDGLANDGAGRVEVPNGTQNLLDPTLSSSQMLDAWTDDHLTEHQKRWTRAEHALVNQLLTPGSVVIDIGCGDARLLESLDRSAEYIGIDIQAATIAAAKEKFANRPATRFETGDMQVVLPDLFSERDAQDASKFARNSRIVICIGNTLGSWGTDRAQAVRAMLQFADTVLVSVVSHDPETIFKRLEYYQKNNLNCRVDWELGSVFSEQWGESKSFNEESLRKLAELAAADDIRIAMEFHPDLGGMGLAMVIRRENTQ